MHLQDKWVIKQLRDVGLDAIIFGSAIREEYFNEESDELDIYLFVADPEDPRLELNKIIHTLELGKVPNVDFIREENVNFEEEFSDDSPIERVISVDKQGRYYKLHIGSIPSKLFVSDWISVGLNKCFYDGKKTHYSTHFLNDFNNKSITILNGQDAPHLWVAVTYHTPEIMFLHPGFTVKIDIKHIMTGR